MLKLLLLPLPRFWSMPMLRPLILHVHSPLSQLLLQLKRWQHLQQLVCRLLLRQLMTRHHQMGGLRTQQAWALPSMPMQELLLSLIRQWTMQLSMALWTQRLPAPTKPWHLECTVGCIRQTSSLHNHLRMASGCRCPWVMFLPRSHLHHRLSRDGYRSDAGQA